jgi:uncharacterized integral membrane protein
LEPESRVEATAPPSEVNSAADEAKEPQEPMATGLASHGLAPKVSGAPVPRSRAGQAWKSLIPALVLVAVMLVFVFENLREAKVSFLMFSGRFPLALALLVAAALGALVVFCLGSVRIVQLRKAFRRHQGRPETTRGER